MTQFKFGDLVKRKSDGAVGIVVSISFKSVLVFFDGNAVSSFYDADDFEIIPHPDTARLDWLARNDCALTERLCDEDGGSIAQNAGLICLAILKREMRQIIGKEPVLIDIQ